MGEGDALEGEQFLVVDGLEDGDEVGLEVSDGVEVFEADDGEVGGSEAVFARVWAERALPSGERGPEERAALARLAASCFWETGLCSGV